MATKRGSQVGDTCKITGPEHPERETSGRQVGDTCKITGPRAPGEGDKWETNVKSHSPERPERATNVKSCDPEHPEREKTTGRQV